MKDFTKQLGKEDRGIKYWFLSIKNQIKNWLIKTFPKRIKRLVVNTNEPNSFSGDISNLVNLTYFRINGKNTITGSVTNLPKINMQKIIELSEYYPSYKL